MTVMMKSLGLAALLLLSACAGISGNGGTEMYGEISAGVETGKTAVGR